MYKMLVKKVYCNHCSKLVKGVEKLTNNVDGIHCPKCDTQLSTSIGGIWRGSRSK